MFDNLKQPNPSANNANADKAVDDIFAETEAPSINNMSNSGNNIEAQPAGLAAQPYVGDDNKESGGGFKFKTVIIIVLAILIISALAYFVYSKFLSGSDASDETNIVLTENTLANQVDNTSKDVPPVNNPNGNDSFVEPTDNTDFVIPGDVVDDTLNPVEPVEPVEPVIPVVVAPVDSDADSLTDSEEIALGTNINLIDSDFDGLSDYEEVRVYGSDPLNADTDGDGYQDGEEVEGGYNPNGVGILQ